MSTAPAAPATRVRQPAPPLLILFLVLPVLVHVGLLVLSFFNQELAYIGFEHLDLGFLLGTVAYLAAAAFAAASRAFATRFVLVVYASLLAFGIAEVTARILLPEQPQGLPQAPKRDATVVGENIPGLTGTTCVYTVNTIGLRGPDVKLDDMDVRILCVGGSTTECPLVSDDKTWPARLQDKLAERLGKKVYVGNAGVSGRFTLHHAYLIEHYQYVPKFEWVVVMSGINDFGRAKDQWNYASEEEKVPQEALTPVFKNVFYYRRLGLVRLIQRVHLYWGAPASIAQDGMAEWLRVHREKRQEAIKAGRVNDDLPKDDLKVWCEVYRENLLKVINACRAQEVNVLMLTQPTMYRKDLPEDLHKLITTVGGDGVAPSLGYQEQGLRAYNRTMLQLCRKEGIDCIDLDAKLPKNTSIFYDECHFNLTGCERVADILAEFFARKLAEKK